MSKILKITLVAGLVISVITTLSITQSVKGDTSADCSLGAGLIGRITDNGESSGTATAQVTNNMPNCNYQVGFASYKMIHQSPDPRTDQTLFDSSTSTVGPNQTITLQVRVPDCRYQLDLFRGSVLQVPTYEGVDLDHAFVRTNLCTAPAITAPVIITPVASAPVATAPANQFPVGSLDTADCTMISGWAVDPDADSKNSALQINIFADGPEGIGTLIKSVTTDTLRPDVNIAMGVTGNHGFTISTASLPTSFLNGASHQVWVFARDPQTGLNKPIANPATLNTAACSAAPAQTQAPVAPGVSTIIVSSRTTAGTPIISCFSLLRISPNAQRWDHQCVDRPFSFANFLPGTYNIEVDQNDSARFTSSFNLQSVNPNSSQTVPADGTIRWEIIWAPKTAALTATPTPSPTPTPATATPTPTPIPTQVINNAACAINAFNSCNTNTSSVTTTTSNTSNITQNGNGNVAGVNQAGAINPSSSAGNYNPTPTQLSIPTGNPYQYNYGVTNFASQPIYVPTPTPYPTPVYAPYQYHPVSYPLYVPTPTYSPIPQYSQSLNIQKFGHNISRGENTDMTSFNARTGDTVQFDVLISAPSNTTLYNVVVSDALPVGLTYSARSSSLNNVQINDGIVSGGINIGTLSAGQQVRIKFFATVNSGLANNQVLVNTASARADNVGTINSQPVYITINNTSVLKAALHVRTGPTGDTFAISGLGALMTSALYVGRRRILDAIKFV